MKILFLNTSDKKGGAAIACYRLFSGLKKLKDVEIKMLVKNKITDDADIIVEKRPWKKFLNKIKYIIDTVPTKIFFKTKNEIIHSPAIFSSLNIKKVRKINPDIVHLHWICGGFMSIKDLKRIKKPIVWTLHDMWAFCGAEHYAKNTTRYIDGYNNKNRPPFEKGFDLNKWTWQRKKKHWRNLNITIVTPSKWLAKCAKQSNLFKNKEIKIIPYGLDINIFKPTNKKKVRKILNLPQNKKLILFGAINATNDKRKGFIFFQKALKLISHKKYKNNIEILIFGSSKPKKSLNLGFKINYLGNINSEKTLSLIYSSADLFIIPSTEDNLPNTVIESLACGTPCIGFNIGGIPDMIDHKNNGYLAKPYDTDGLAEGIDWILNKSNYNELCKNARKKAEQKFDDNIIAQKYIELYNDILKNNKHD